MNIRENKGISLVALTITIIILLVITGAIIYNTKGQLAMKEINALRNDIDLLKSKVDDYYLKYGELPELCFYCTKPNFLNGLYDRANEKGATLNSQINIHDGGEYVVIDLEKLGGLTLNYGYDKDANNSGEYFEIKDNASVTQGGNGYPTQSAIYVINTATHQIYFPHGIFEDNIMYYTF